MNLKNILWVRNTGKIVPNAPIADNLFGLKLSDSGVITTVTGNPISIVTNKAQNAISTILSYSPKQTGSGDPSPQNIRPIEGWTEANLNVAGKNLLAKPIVKLPTSTTADDCFFIKKGTYRLSFSESESYRIAITIFINGDRMTDTDHNPNSSSMFYSPLSSAYYSRSDVSSGNVSMTLSIIEDCYIRVYVNKETTTVSNGQIELGSQATDYVPFVTPTTITQSLGGTYYGFSIDLERGVLRVTHEIVDLDSLEWTEDGSSTEAHRIWTTLILDKKNGAVNIICEKLQTTTQSTANMPEYSIRGANNSVRIYACDSDYSTSADFITAITGTKAVYELATPIELPLTPQTVALLAGNNTLWCDGDSLSVTYKAKKS